MAIFNHPKEVNMTYLEHMQHSLYFALLLFISSIKAIIHAFLPNLFVTSTSDCVKIIATLLNMNEYY